MCDKELFVVLSGHPKLDLLAPQVIAADEALEAFFARGKDRDDFFAEYVGAGFKQLGRVEDHDILLTPRRHIEHDLNNTRMGDAVEQPQILFARERDACNAGAIQTAVGIQHIAERRRESGFYVGFFDRLSGGDISRYDACAQLDADCQLLFTTPNGDLQKHLQNLETVIEQGVDGIVTVIVNDDLYDEAVKKAIDKGIPVISANVDDTKRGDGNARLAFVGQDLFQAGYLLMQGLYKKIPEDQPVHALLGLSRPGESWAEDRIGGAKKFLDEAKAANPNRQITY